MGSLTSTAPTPATYPDIRQRRATLLSDGGYSEMDTSHAKTFKTRWLFAWLAVPTLLLAACGGEDDAGEGPSEAGEGSAAAGPDDWDAVIKAAQEEGETVSYSTQGLPISEAQQPIFADKYGIEFSVGPPVATTDMLERIQAEFRADAVQADILTVADFTVWLSEPDRFLDLDTAGLPNYESYPEKGKWKDKCVAVVIDPSTILYNTDLVDPADAPKTWSDLLDPKWKGQLALTDPRAAPSYNSYMFALGNSPDYGLDFLEGIAAQEPALFDSGNPLAEQVSAGAYMIGLQPHVTNSAALIADGAPLKHVIPDDPPHGAAINCAGILADAPHPNAAKVFLNFLMSPEAQSAGCEAAGYPSLLADTTCDVLPDTWAPPDRDPETGALPGQSPEDEERLAEVYDALGLT